MAGGSTNVENPLNNFSVWQTNPYMCYYDLYVCQYMKVSICWKFKFVSYAQLLFILLEKMFIAMKTEISLYATWNSKNTRDFIYLSSWSPSAKRGRKLRHKKMSVFPWLCVSQLWSPAQALFYLFYLKYHSIFMLLFSPIKSFWDNESEVPIRATLPQGQCCKV